MKRLLAGALSCALLSTAAGAAVKEGETAPDFTLQAAVGGKSFTFQLSEALKKGPVVLYFYPKSFTRGCTIEAHDFADNAENFAAAGATLIGLSADNIDTQIDFSSKECRDKFPVAADPDAAVIRSYDALRASPGRSGAVVPDRISFVIAPDGKIIYAYQDRAPEKHIENTLAAVRHWRDEHKP
ncbi:peroxiredoxin [Rhodoblastus sp.]|uniref:peroxiredoxin n=1 Tax=Rhodoblastus sp. TaxID=1962975 RepID=UPI003F99D0D8